MIYVVVIVLAAQSAIWSPTAAQADGQTCYETADLYSVEVVCEYTGQTLQAAQEAEPKSTWLVYQLCKDGTSGGVEACSNPRACTVDGRTGTLYAVFRDGTRVGTACLTADEAADVDDPPIRTLVIRAFDELDWSPSALSVQPPNGKTLVNLETNFFTANTQASSIPVQLQGSNVVVTARPVAYRWNFGDGTSETTTSPGAPYPGLDVAHVYEQVEQVAVSVDTQYGAASFTVDGGPPETIPSTIWVTGASEDLEVVEALPQLVLR
ncbi:PKD domain-containing protein [Nocardioides sp. zg-1228]|uniref:PKD domain-containing protein n=1 Tax=Nocardioides sp. zg-1228 TaxID=2763008 RepID=UPI001642F895|nr:hypothetical protein [Nocardioides sp. zg-1228]MBC2931522.1 hypothetical protein [Nocardioides sp. zg-1228]QSF57125.1 hypothetical protein JX575_16380 [Nocardioides sp. zg-1228]